MTRDMYYPGGDNGAVGERVQTKYLPQNLVKYSQGSDGAYYYLQNASYDAAGRTDLLYLGAASLAGAPVLQERDYRYFNWNTTNGQGRLMWIKSSTYTSPTSLQDLRFCTNCDTTPVSS